RFIVLGDHQVVDDDRYEVLVNAARNTAKSKYGERIEDHINFVLNLGDQVNTGNLDQWERLHFYQSRGLMSNLPFITLIGNHDDDGTGDLSHYFAHFIQDDRDFLYQGMQGKDGEHYYAFQVANSVFALFDTIAEAKPLLSRQDAFARQISQAVEKDPNVDWYFGAGHKPILAEQLPGDASDHMREVTLPELVESGKMALYLAGHAHLYARGALRHDPVHHVINGGASWDQYWDEVHTHQRDHDDVQKTIEGHVFQIIEIDLQKREMHAETYTTGSKLADNYAVDNVRLIDRFYRKLDGKGPQQPGIANLSQGAAIPLPFTFVGTQYQGSEPYNSTEFQLVSLDGSFDKPELTVKRDYENIYLSSGAPHYHPIDQNKGVNIFELRVGRDQLPGWLNKIRVRYRDQNLNWSPWSKPTTFVVNNGLQEQSTHLPEDAIVAHWQA
ncbi:MAG: metallophosphoesterase, partial [Porticoccaceae bacterium]|nr:metallophosphoesterase [Porticoccaceae bacterium]